MGFPRQEYWSGLPFSPPGDLLIQGANSGLLHHRQVFYQLSHQGSRYKEVIEAKWCHKPGPQSNRPGVFIRRGRHQSSLSVCICTKEKARWGQSEKVAICKPGRKLSPEWKYLIPVSREWVISSVLSHHSKNLKWQTNVTAQLQLNFIQQAKESTPSRREGGPTPKERPQSILASSFYTFVSSSTKPTLCKAG